MFLIFLYHLKFLHDSYEKNICVLTFVALAIFFVKVWNVAKPYIEKYCAEHFPESRPSSPTAFSLETPQSPQKRVRLE